MENFLARYRNASVLVVVLLAQVIALATQVKRSPDPRHPEAGSVRLIRLWAVSAITPLEKALVNTSGWMQAGWANYAYLRGVREQNRALRAELDRMRLAQVRLSEDAAQARRLQALLDFKQQFVSQTVAAQVIGSSGSEQSRLLYLDKGTGNGIALDMPVITPEGIVGKVIRVFPSASQVLEITDPSSGVGVILEKSRLLGILKGTPGGQTEVQYVMADEKVDAGERVLTSGGDSVFPKGLPVGIVQRAVFDRERDPFLKIQVKPATDLGRLEEVLVITRVAERQPEAPELPTRMRAADILAQRLPGVKNKPEAAATMAAIWRASARQKSAPPKAQAKPWPPPAGAAPEPAPAAGSTASPATGAPSETLPQRPAAGSTVSPAIASNPPPAGNQPPAGSPATATASPKANQPAVKPPAKKQIPPQLPPQSLATPIPAAPPAPSRGGLANQHPRALQRAPSMKLTASAGALGRALGTP